MKTITVLAGATVIAAAAFTVFVPTWTGRPSTQVEVGFPQEINFQLASARNNPANKVPPPLPPAATGGLSATEAYKNVQVLTDISAAEFMRVQEAITAWVSPKQGCAFCHTGTDYASDAKPTKLAARVMMQMTRHLNTDWSNHVAQAGVTCFTCHRGQPVPAQIWFPDAPKPERPLIGKQDNWQESADGVRKFFPDNGFAEWYLDDQPVQVQSSTIEPSHTIGSWPEAKRVYEMMMQMSDGIGVNCGFCHNSRAFSDWAQSTPYRWNNWYALRMVQDLNKHFLTQLAALMPQTRVLTTETRLPVLPGRMTGVQAGNGYVMCATCHQGITHPMNGANMVRDYPGLGWVEPKGPIPPEAAPPGQAQQAGEPTPHTQILPTPPPG